MNAQAPMILDAAGFRAARDEAFTKFKNNFRRKKKIPGNINVDKALDVIASEIMAKDKNSEYKYEVMFENIKQKIQEIQIF